MHYNDLDKDITNAFERVISQDREWIKTLIVSRTEFTKIKEKENKTTDDFLKLLINSFGNSMKGFMYSKEISDLKYNLAKEIIEKHDVFSGYKQTETYKKVTSGEEWNWFNEKQEKHKILQQLQRLQQLDRLQKVNKIKATNKSYHDFSEVYGAILYLDPPYEGTSQDGYINSFNSQEFYDWAFEMAKNNIVIISSYSISDERFEVVYSFDKARGTLQGGQSNKGKMEKLFMVKGS